MKLLLILTLSLLMQFSNETDQQVIDKGSLSLELTNVQIEKGGKIYIAVFDREETFMTEKRYKGMIVDVDEKSTNAKLTFEDLPYGDYVVSAFHDTNANGKMDFDSNGMPTEDWATSGTVNPYGPPTWQAAKIRLREANKQIDLNFKR